MNSVMAGGHCSWAAAEANLHMKQSIMSIRCFLQPHVHGRGSTHQARMKYPAHNVDDVHPA